MDLDGAEQTVGDERDYTITAVERSFQLMEVIAANPDCTLAELARLTGFSRSLVFRMTFTMEKCGYVMRTRERGGYKLAYRTLYLSACAQDQIPLIQASRPFIDDLARRTGLNVNVNVRQGLFYLTVLSRHQSDPENLYARTGRLGPLYAGGAPKILLAFAPEHIRDKVLSGKLEKLTDATMVDPVEIAETLEQIRKTGANETIRDVYPDGFAFAAAIRGADGSVVASISLAGTLDQLTPENRATFRAAVHDTAGRISETLGFTKWGQVEF
jgi:IclR family transcriptional regulator, KDG regulon repressor